MRHVLSRYAVCVATTLIYGLLSGPETEAQVVRLKGDRANGSGAVIGNDKHKEGVKRHVLVLTAYHVLKDNTVTIHGNPVTLIAKDEKTDLALVKVLDFDSGGYFIAHKGMSSTGKAVLYGYPSGEFSAQDCTVDEKGDLSCKVRAGGSGGPLVMGRHFVVGVLTRYHGVATRNQIETLINDAGYGWLFQISKGYEHLYVPDDAAARATNDNSESVEEYLDRILKEVARDLQEHQQWMERFNAEQDRWMRQQERRMRKLLERKDD